jgi:predicted porin
MEINLMKKSLLALAVLGTFAGAAQAQSSVTLFGIADAAYSHYSGGSNGSVNRMDNSALNSSRIGFRGVEDMGGGLKAGFWLEAGQASDNGAGSATNTNNNPSGAALAGLSGGQGLTFNRRATMSIMGGWGELRVGRDYTPTFWNLATFDNWGANGTGQGTNLTVAGKGMPALGLIGARVSNSMAYFLPDNIGGWYGRFTYALGEQAAGATASDGRYTGFLIGWTQGPMNIGLASATAKYNYTVVGPTLAAPSPLGVAAVGAGTVPVGDYKVFNLGTSYDFGMAKAYVVYNSQKQFVAKQVDSELAADIPVGAGLIRVTWTKKNDKNFADSNATQVSTGYIYNFSKRTAAFGFYSRLTQGVGASTTGTAAGADFYGVGGIAGKAGETVSGLQIGLRHIF